MRSKKQTTKTETANQKYERDWQAFLREANRHQITKPAKREPAKSYEGQALRASILDLTDPD